MSEVLAIYPGTFDPCTNGHIDIIERAFKLFPRLVVAIAASQDKGPLFTIAERREVLREALAHLPRVEIDVFATLLVDYVRQRGGEVIVRGLRAVSDFEFEFQMALMNRRLEERIETVFLMPHERYTYLSSRLVKEVALLGGNVKGLVPPLAEKLLRERFMQAQRHQA